MKVEILHIEECPNWAVAASRVRAALEACDLSKVEVEHRLLLTDADAAQAPFAGSPTILIDGVDAFPTDGRIDCLACRIYRTEAGFAGAPTTDELIRAIREKSIL